MSRILDQAPDQVTCLPRRQERGRSGQTVFRETGQRVQVWCRVHPLSYRERVDLGVQHEVTARIVARDWPLDEFAIVLHDGYRWEQISREYRSSSPRVRHWVVHVRRLERI